MSTDTKFNMNFKHESLHKIFGFDKTDPNHKIPYIRIDNPLVYILKTKKKVMKSN
jgi:hypothetical protein